MKNFLRLDYWPRPERSGMFAVLSAYAMLCGWGFALVPHDFGGDGFSREVFGINFILA
jgi:hypothetical protein